MNVKFIRNLKLNDFLLFGHKMVRQNEKVQLARQLTKVTWTLTVEDGEAPDCEDCVMGGSELRELGGLGSGSALTLADGTSTG